MECVQTASYSVRINGGVHGWFKGKRGLRQGDPISPYLFVICAEYFSRMATMVTTGSEFNFHPGCDGLRITHLAYADDMMLFSRGDPPSVRILWEALIAFGDVSGLRVNPLKSSMFMAGIDDRDRELIGRITGIQEGNLPVRYLGIPLLAGRLLAVHYMPFVQRIVEQIGSWAPSSLSFAGRLQLILSVLQGIQCFWLSILPVPSVVIDEVVRLCRGFLWDHGRPQVAWADLSTPRREGGLGIRDMRVWNSALLSQALWNIHAKVDSLWVRWIHHRYIRRASIWSIPLHKDHSPLFKRILQIRDILLLREGSEDRVISRFGSWRGRRSMTAYAYDYFRTPRSVAPWACVVWSPLTPPKYSFVAWLAIRGRLQTRDRLDFLDIDPTCQLCTVAHETAHHLFFTCTFSSAVWGEIRRWAGITRGASTLRSSVRFLRRGARRTACILRLWRLAFACTIYHIWSCRNRLLFDHCIPVVSHTVRTIQTQVYRVMLSRYPTVCIPSM